MRQLTRFVSTALLGGFAAASASADSLYAESGYESLASDVVAHRPGDTLTVLVFEQSSGSATASAGTDRSTSIAAAAEGEISGVGGGEAAGRATIQHDFAGEGAIERTGQLVARVSVQVTEVLPNGDLVVSGKQEIVFNQEVQSIVINGQVRPYDISPDNTVASPRLSSASIEYTGEGLLARAERKSWLSLLFDWLF